MKGAPVGANNEQVVVTTGEEPTEPVAPVGPPVEGGGEEEGTEPKTYDEEYVKGLRD